MNLAEEYNCMKKLMIFVLSFVVAMCLSGCNKESTSIGIIGGADGPTAIFITSKINWLAVFGFVGIIIAAVLVVLIIYRNKKKK